MTKKFRVYKKFWNWLRKLLQAGSNNRTFNKSLLLTGSDCYFRCLTTLWKWSLKRKTFSAVPFQRKLKLSHRCSKPPDSFEKNCHFIRDCKRCRSTASSIGSFICVDVGLKCFKGLVQSQTAMFKKIIWYCVKAHPRNFHFVSTVA